MQVDGVDVHHLFCGRRGTWWWTRGDIPEIGGRFVIVFVPAMDDLDRA